MSMQWVRNAYGVPARRGGRIRFNGKPGRILSATHLLHVELEGGSRFWIHPTWRVEYLDEAEAAS